MRAAVFNEPGSVTVGERPDPSLVAATDALVRVVLACVCGSDLWYYRGESKMQAGNPIGHEFIGIVEDVGADVATLSKGDLVIAPFAYSDGTCPHCQHGMQTACVQGGYWAAGVDGGQGEAVRVPFADGTLVAVPGSGHSEQMLAAMLTLSDVMPTGHHAAVSAGVKQGDTVAVVGDGAVGLSGVIAAKRLGAERIIALSRNPARQKLALAFGATEIVAGRGEEAVASVLELTAGVGADATLECVGTGQAMETAFAVARPGSIVGYVGVPHGVELPISSMFRKNKGIRGGVAPARAYIPELLKDVLEGWVQPAEVFDLEVPLDGVSEAYAAMDERRAIKSLLRVATI